MLGLCTKNFLTANDKRKLRDFKSAYNFNAQYYGVAIFFVIVKMMRPDTRVGFSDTNYNLENMKISNFKNNTPKSNLKIAEWMNYI